MQNGRRSLGVWIFNGAGLDFFPRSLTLQFNLTNGSSTPNFYHSLYLPLLPRQSRATIPHVLLANHLTNERLPSSPLLQRSFA